MPEAPARRESPVSPLRWRTPVVWVAQATRDLPVFLNDHAHLERKAASNALELLNRWPWPVDVHAEDARAQGADRWSRTLTSIARDEVRHLGQVLRLLSGRAGHFARSHVNPYAAGLRGLVRMGQGMSELLDRLLVSALIEARSMERFELLAGHAPGRELRDFYGSLVASERGHYRAFLELAALLPPTREGVEKRWSALRDEEARIIAAQRPACSMHGGLEE